MVSASKLECPLLPYSFSRFTMLMRSKVDSAVLYSGLGHKQELVMSLLLTNLTKTFRYVLVNCK